MLEITNIKLEKNNIIGDYRMKNKRKDRIDRNDKLRVYLGLAISAMVILTAAVWFMYSGSGSGFSIKDAGVPFVAIILACSAGYLIWRKKESVDSGLPMEDEFSKKVMHRAGYYAYFASMYTALAVSIFEEEVAGLVGISKLAVSDVAGIVILVPAIVFFIAIFYFKRRGDVE
jgi:hypothetical protein